MTTYTGTSQDVTLSTGTDILVPDGVIKAVNSLYAITSNSAGTESFRNQGLIYGQNGIRGRFHYLYNDGTIQATFAGMVGTFGRFQNTGHIVGDVYIQNVVGSSTYVANYNGAQVYNYGTMQATEFNAPGSHFSLTNNGSMDVGLRVNCILVQAGSDATIINSGTITTDQYGGPAIVITSAVPIASISNSGTIGGVTGIESAALANTIENYNVISGRTYGLSLSGGTATIYNAGTVTGQTASAIKSTTALTITNDGTIRGKTFAIEASDAVDMITNSGLISGSIKLAGGADVYDGTFGRVTGTIDLGDGANTATGGAFADTIVGGADSDTIDGGGGADTMTGGAGFDTYFVDNARDKVIEAAGGGIDTVFASVSYVLTAGQEIETLIADPAIGALPINLTGNEFDNDIWGNAETNRLSGGGGNDTLRGFGGGDTFNGGDGFDFVSYAASANGAGVIVNLTAQGSNGGFATGDVLSGIEGVIGTRYADTLTGDANINEFQGLLGNDRLDGKAGADRMYGGAGDDIYYVDVADDLAVEVESGVDQGGNDTVYSTATAYQIGAAIESLRLLGSADLIGDGNGGANTIFGNSGANLLRGFAGADTIKGGAGADMIVGGIDKDTLFGEAGADTFVFASGDTGITATTYDFVQDFKHADGDRIDLDIVGAGGVTLSDANYAERTVASDAFGTALTAANSAMADGLHNAVFVAGTTTGWLFWNTDSNLQTPDQAIRLSSVNNVGLFDRTDIV